nr:immunoglobulin light chain junction region [Macaca mulatta]
DYYCGTWDSTLSAAFF